MGSFSITHWLIFLAVVVLVFGTSKLKNIGRDVGGAVKDFKDAVQEENKEQVTTSKQADKTIEHEKNQDTATYTDASKVQNSSSTKNS